MSPAALSKPAFVVDPFDSAQLGRLGREMPSWALALALVLLAAGFVIGLALGPWDQNQLAMLHVPAVWVSMLLLLSAAFWAAIAVVLERDSPHVLVHAIVPTGGMFAFLALWSGSLWIRSLHGVWWMGSAREWAGAALLAVYLLMLCLPALIGSRRRADRAVSVVALLGVSQVLLIYFSTEWWNAGYGITETVTVVAEMMPAMLIVALGLWAYATATAGMRLVSLLLERDKAPTEMAEWS